MSEPKRDVTAPPLLFPDGDEMTAKTRYMVVASGAGEYKHDFNVVWVEAPTAEDAARIATSPEMGYGDDDGDVLYVCRTECVTRFITAVRTAAEPVEEPR